MRSLVVCMLALASASAHAQPRSRPARPAHPAKPTASRKEADRHFKTGVALFGEGRYGEALAEFERAYELAPHPIVLYNIAGCHRELQHYREAVAFYNRFLVEGPSKVPPERLVAARTELDTIYARTARVTVTLAPTLVGATLAVDGTVLDKPEMPLLLPPGEHRLTARAEGRRDADKVVHVASGDEVTVPLVLDEPPLATPPPPPPEALGIVPPIAPRPTERPWWSLSAGMGVNLRRASSSDNGAPSVGFSVALGNRLELGADAVLVAFAVVPTVRVRVAGDRLSLHVIGALPIAITDGDMSEVFYAGGGGLGLRYRPAPWLGLSLEAYAAYAGKAHGTTVPSFLRGELWF